MSKNAGASSINYADHVLEIVVGKSSGCAPDTVDLMSVSAAATDIGVGEAAEGDATTDGDAATEVLGDIDAVGLMEPHAAISEPATMTTTTERLRLSTG